MNPEDNYPIHPTCIGCRENQPNQLAHMDYGGCLYMDDQIEEQNGHPDQTNNSYLSQSDTETASSVDTTTTTPLLPEYPNDLEDTNSDLEEVYHKN